VTHQQAMARYGIHGRTPLELLAAYRVWILRLRAQVSRSVRECGGVPPPLPCSRADRGI
jgi:hypothetical protein